ncbi:MAG: nitronate monooxygenase, partial [Acetobacter sp.]|nr:nitronate monooxygenase [Acetobacter sp.]
QVRIAHEMAGGRGRLHANFLWEMGAAERVIAGVLEGAPGLVHGLTCGAGMPYRLAELAAKFGVYYYPIVSSGRALSALWKRSFHRVPELLGGVVYEDPWYAGGHNGFSNTENPSIPEDPYQRVLVLRQVMRGFGLHETPIIMAGGIWWLEEWEDWIENAELGPIVFQFGTRPLLTQESPIPEAWKQRLRQLHKGDVHINRFSPTGFYSSAVNNDFLQELKARSDRQIAFSSEPQGNLTVPYSVGERGRQVFITSEDKQRIHQWEAQGYVKALATPDTTLIFVTPDKAREIVSDQAGCMGCLSQCRFSNWSQQGPAYTTGHQADPRSFCIQKTLQAIAHADGPDQEIIVDHNLMFSGANAWRFREDPFYANGFVPTIAQLIERIMVGR